jgi:hypothetical protein
MLGDVKMDDLPPRMGQHNEDEKHSKLHRRDDKEFDGYQFLDMLFEKCLP